MNFSRLLLYLTLFYCSFSVIILYSTPTSTAIVTPLRAVAIDSPYYSSFLSGIAGPGVNWITSNASARTIRYESLFYSSCIGSANLTITAGTSFFAYFDGAYLGYGSNYSAVFNFPLNITCGNHNLTVYVRSNNFNIHGLTFSINQDQLNCYNCEFTGYWNEHICACSCISTQCACTAPRIWKPYPFCGCGCPPVRINGTDFIVSTIVSSLDL
jgi:hypothetical protein